MSSSFALCSAVVETNVATNLDDLTLQKEIGMIINEHGIDYLEREFGMYIIDSIDYAVGYTACYHVCGCSRTLCVVLALTWPVIVLICAVRV